MYRDIQRPWENQELTPATTLEQEQIKQHENLTKACVVIQI